MSEALAVTIGLFGLAFLFLYAAFTLTKSEQGIIQNISVLLAFMGLVFMDLLMFALFKIAEQTSNISYLTSGVLLAGLRAMIAVTSVLSFTLLLTIIIQLILFLKNFIQKKLSRRAF